MTLKDCEPYLRLFQHIRRDIWFDGFYVTKGLDNHLYIRSADNTIELFDPDQDDLSANDWNVPSIDDPGICCGKCGKRIQHEEQVEVESTRKDEFVLYNITHKRLRDG